MRAAALIGVGKVSMLATGTAFYHSQLHSSVMKPPLEAEELMSFRRSFGRL